MHDIKAGLPSLHDTPGKAIQVHAHIAPSHGAQLCFHKPSYLYSIWSHTLLLDCSPPFPVKPSLMPFKLQRISPDRSRSQQSHTCCAQKGWHPNSSKLLQRAQ